MKKIPIRHIKTAVEEPGLAGSFIIRDIKAMLSAKDMLQELHRHDFFFILILEKGTGEHIIDFVSYAVADRSVFFMRPGQVHQLTLKKGCSGYLIQFNRDFYSPREKSAKQVFRKVSSKNYCQAGSAHFKKLISLLANMLGEYTGKQERYKETIKAYLEIFFIELARQSQYPGKVSDESKLYAQDRLEELSELIETHITTNKQVAQYAAMMHLTPYQLNAITKAALGKTCSALIDEYIILEAKRSLLATTELVNNVADQLGYEDVSYFTRFFKKHTGYSPEAFRHKFR